MGGGDICRWSSGNKKRGDKDLTAVGAAGWRLRRLNLSVWTEKEGPGAVRSLPHRVRSAPHKYAHRNVATSRQRTGSTPTPPEHRPVWRSAGDARPTCAPSACVKETPSSSSVLSSPSWITGSTSRGRDIMGLWIKLVVLCCCCFGASADFNGR